MGDLGDVARGMHFLMAGPKHSVDEIESIILAVPPIRDISTDRLSPAAYLTALLRDPAFQMK